MTAQCADHPKARLGRVLRVLGLPSSTWYYRGAVQPKPPGPARRPVPEHLAEPILATAQEYPFWGYKRIAVVCRRAGVRVSNKQVYRVMQANGLLLKPKPRAAELHQAAKLFELLPTRPNDLWQTDVTYIHIPGHGWWYAVTVIDYFSRYLLALHLTDSYAAGEVNKAIDQAVAAAEALHGKLARRPFLVTDNGTSFLAKRFKDAVAEQFQHVRIQYRTPTQLGLLERFHQTLKEEEVYWRLYDNPGHCRESLAKYRDLYNNVRPHWALRPEEGGDPFTPAQVYAKGARITIPKWQHWAKAAQKKLHEMMNIQEESAQVA